MEALLSGQSRGLAFGVFQVYWILFPVPCTQLLVWSQASQLHLSLWLSLTIWLMQVITHTFPSQGCSRACLCILGPLDKRSDCSNLNYYFNGSLLRTAQQWGTVLLKWFRYLVVYCSFPNGFTCLKLDSLYSAQRQPSDWHLVNRRGWQAGREEKPSEAVHWINHPRVPLKRISRRLHSTACLCTSGPQCTGRPGPPRGLSQTDLVAGFLDKIF